MTYQPYRDLTQPGRFDVNGVEWWACDPYPTWYRWEKGVLRQDHAKWSNPLSRIYVASSWRNTFQPHVVNVLRAEGHEVYDFKNPAEGNNGFKWSQVMPRHTEGSNLAHVDDYLECLEHPIAVEGFKSDFDAMNWAQVGVLVLPCGRSAHDEIGWMAGSGRATAVLLDPDPDGMVTPELMYKMHDLITPHLQDIVSWLGTEVFGVPYR